MSSLLTPQTLQPIEVVRPNSLLAVAVFFGKTRLIDNIRLAVKEYDFVVIGSGIAGLTFALKAATHGSVAVVTKRKGADTNTAWAQGGIACVTSDEDSFDLACARHARGRSRPL